MLAFSFHSFSVIYFRIESATLDGKDRRVVVSNVPHVFGVTLYENYIYWTDWATRSVMRADKISGDNRISLKEKLDAQPMDIKIFSLRRQNCMYIPFSCLVLLVCFDYNNVLFIDLYRFSYTLFPQWWLFRYMHSRKQCSHLFLP